MEATLYFDELTTEVIADGKHLDARAAAAGVQGEGAGPARARHRLDAGRGHAGRRVLVRRRGTASASGSSTASASRWTAPPLASGVMGMDHCVRTMHRDAGVPLPEAVRMASLTPARILGVEDEVGSLEAGKRADLVVLDAELDVRQVYVGGERIVWSKSVSENAFVERRVPRAPTFGGRELAPLLVRNCTARVPSRKCHKGTTDHRGAFSPGISSVPLWWGSA